MNDFVSVFVGVPQSRYAALAILLAIVIVALVILFGRDSVPISQKFGFIFLVFLVSLPGLALSLFQLTCIVTGSGFKNKRWWCSMYAWVISAFMIFYAVLLVLAAVMSLVNHPAPVVVKSKEQFQDMMNKANSVAADLVGGNIVSKADMNKLDKTLETMYSEDPMMMTSNDESTDVNMEMGMEMYTNHVKAKNNSADEFKVNGDSSLPSPFPGNSQKSLGYAPGAKVNGQVLPMPSTRVLESFYSPAEFKK